MITYMSKFFTIKNIAYLLLVVICMIPGYILVRYGIHFCDEPYQIMNTMDVHRSPMAPLTSWLSCLLGRQTDFNWMSYRYLAVTLNNLAFIIGGIYLYQKSKSISVTAITCAVVVFLSGISRTYHNLFGWDSWTAFFVIMLMYCVLTFMDCPTWWRLILMSIVSALTAAVRIPNVVSLPIIWSILLYISLKNRNKYKWYFAWIYLSGSLILIICIIIALYGSIWMYVMDMRKNVLSAHSFSEILWSMSYSFTNLTLIVMAFMTFLKGWSYAKSEGKRIRILVLIVSCIAIIWFLFINKVEYIYYDVYWAVLAILVVGWRAFKKHDAHIIIQMVTIFFLGIVCVAGSNTGLVKFPGFLIAPFVTAFLLQIYNGDTNIIKYNAYRIVIPFAVFGIAYYIPFKAFYDTGVIKTTTRIQNGRAKDIFTTAERACIVSEIEQLKMSISKDSKILAIGEGYNRFAYEYLLDCHDYFAPHEWEGKPLLDSDDYIMWVKNRIASDENLVIVYLKRPNKSSKMKKFLDENMRICVDNNNTFIVYRPQNYNK